MEINIKHLVHFRSGHWGEREELKVTGFVANLERKVMKLLLLSLVVEVLELFLTEGGPLSPGQQLRGWAMFPFFVLVNGDGQAKTTIFSQVFLFQCLCNL